MAVRASSAIYDRVEVVRGASGLMKSSGEPSASVNLARKRATATEPAGYISTRLGSWRQIGIEADVAAGLNAGGTRRGRIVADVQDGDSFLDRYSSRTQTYLGTLEADVGAATTLSGGVEYRSQSPRGTTWGNWPLVFSDGTRTDFGRGFSTGLDWTQWDSDSRTLFGRVEHDFGNGWQLQAALAHTYAAYDSTLFYTWGQPDPVTGLGMNPYAGRFGREQRSLAGNIDLSSKVEAFGRTHDLSFSVSGSRSRWKGSNVFATNLAPMGSIFDWDGSYPEPAWNMDNAMSVQGQPVRQVSAYSAGRFALGDQLSLIAGARYNRWEESPRRFSNVTPYAGLVWDLNDSLSAYASYTEIFNPQDYQDAAGSYLDPEIGQGYEAGLKAAFFDERLNAGLSVFRSVKDNVAQEIPGVLAPGGTQAYQGVRGVETEGVEVELSGELSPGWQLFAGATNWCSKNPDGSDHNSFLPRNSLRLFTTWQLPGAWEDLTLGGGLNWQDSAYVDFDVDAGPMRYRQQAVTTVDLMARYAISDQLAAQININNLFDKQYYVLRSGDNAPQARPLNATFTLTRKF